MANLLEIQLNGIIGQRLITIYDGDEIHAFQILWTPDPIVVGTKQFTSHTDPTDSFHATEIPNNLDEVAGHFRPLEHCFGH